MKNLLKAGFMTVIALLLLTGCPNPNIPKEKTNEAPTVTLTATAISVTIGQEITFTADAEDDDDDTLTYAWYLDSVKQQDATTSVATWTPDTSGSHTIKVVVSDGEETASDSVTISVSEGTTNPTTGSVRLVNESSRTIAIFQYKSTSSSSWSSDLLSTTIPTGYSYSFTIPAGSYYFYAATSDESYYWANSSPYTVSAGATFTWTLTPP